jgi:very-short-patch-repair endonuclease
LGLGSLTSAVWSEGLVVELDGSVHAQPSQVCRDAARDFALQQAGYTGLRVTNGIVLPDAFSE